jgi:hypothetical protein
MKLDFEKIYRAALFPHLAIRIILVPISVVMLVYSMVFIGTESVAAIISYVLSAYTLTVWCFKIPDVVKFIRTFKDENKYARRWLDDEHLRVNVSLYGSLIFNTAYALLQLGIGFFHGSFWFYSLFGYYLCLSVVRFFLVRYTVGCNPGERMREELIRYRACGCIFLVMNLILSGLLVLMIGYGKTFVHHEITTIAMAAYTFTAFTVAIIDVVKYRKYNSPIYSASKATSLTAACVSILTLESTMLSTFGAAEGEGFRSLMLALTGAAVFVAIVIIAIYMIVRSTKELNKLKEKEINGAE